MLQFITHSNGRLNHTGGASAVLAGGCRWIQLRMKEASDDEFLATGRAIADMCRACGATFIVNDRAHLVGALDADGVHLGRGDISIAEARRMLGPDKIIGATANTLNHMLEASAAGADYIGLGPFRFTTTKKRLSPVLGLEGYSRMMHAFRLESSIPVVAIGGITADDIPALASTGISGIALSGALLGAADPTGATKNILKIISNSIS